MKVGDAAWVISKLILSALDDGTPIDQRAYRRYWRLIPRAAYNIVCCEELLSTIATPSIRTGDVLDTVELLKLSVSGSEVSITKELDLKIWGISSAIDDAQHRIAATFDSCLSQWLLAAGFTKNKLRKDTQDERKKFEDKYVGHPTWRLENLKDAIGMWMSFVESMEFHKKSRASVGLMDQLELALDEFYDTRKAAAGIRDAQANLFAAMKAESRLLDQVFASELVGRLGHKNGQSLLDEQCLAIVIGRVNDIKHRSSPPPEYGEFLGIESLYRFHVELAVTVQALLFAVRFYKEMVSWIENAPWSVQGAKVSVHQRES